MSRRCWASLAAAWAVTLTLASCSPRTKADPAASPSAAASAPVSVDVISARNATLPDDIAAVGTFEAISSVNISPKAPGLLVAVPVNTGQFVAKGDVIMQLDTSALEMTVRQDEADLVKAQTSLGMSRPGQTLKSDRDIPAVRKARATVDNARLAWERSRTLYRADLISQKDLQDDKRALLAAQADYQAALDSVKSDKVTVLQKQIQLQTDQLNLRNATVRAPFSGYVSAVNVDVGDYVQPGGGSGSSGYVTLLTLDPIYCEVKIGETDSQRVRVGQPVEVKTAAYPGRRFKGNVYRISPALDPATRTLKALARIANPERLLKPGLYGNATITLGATPGVVMVPQMAQTEQAGQTCVYVVEQTASGALARMRTLRRGRVDGRWVEAIDSAVRAGDSVVVGNLDRLYDGAPVTPAQTLREAPAVPKTGI